MEGVQALGGCKAGRCVMRLFVFGNGQKHPIAPPLPSPPLPSPRSPAFNMVSAILAVRTVMDTAAVTWGERGCRGVGER